MLPSDHLLIIFDPRTLITVIERRAAETGLHVSTRDLSEGGVPWLLHVYYSVAVAGVAEEAGC